MFNLFIKGFIVGIGKVLPGVSGAMLALSLGVYDILINSLADFKYAIRNFKIIVPLIIGITISILVMSILMKYTISRYYYILISIVIGVMSYEIYKDLKKYMKEGINYKYIIYSIVIVLLLIGTKILKGNTIISEEGWIHFYISLFLCGLVDAFATVVPGISGTALLLLVGYYDKIIEGLSTLNMNIVTPFLIGFILGMLLFSKLFSYLFKMYKECISCIITALAIYSIILLCIDNASLLIQNYLIVIVVTIISFILSRLLDFSQ